MSSHKISSIIASVNAKRGQLARDVAGVIHLYVDASRLLSILRWTVSHRCRRGSKTHVQSDNRRISAVVLTAGAIYDLAPATNQVRSVTFPEVVVPNPHAINPVLWLPGEGEWFVAVR
jgi:hypothetical protein